MSERDIGQIEKAERAVPVSPVSNQLNELCEAVNILEKQIFCLEGALEPVLNPARLESETSKRSEQIELAELCSIGHQIRNCQLRIHDHIDSLRRLQSCLEI